MTEQHEDEKMNDIKKITQIQWGVVGSVVVGMVAFGAAMYAIKQSPAPAAVKKAADAVS